jgi:hypothetical protein
LENKKVEAEDAKVGSEMLVKMPILKSKNRKDGTSEDICKVPKKKSKP